MITGINWGASCGNEMQTRKTTSLYHADIINSVVTIMKPGSGACLQYYFFIHCLFLVCFAVDARAEFLVSHRTPVDAEDTRDTYTISVIKLSLEKTRAKYGDYRLVGIPPLNYPRSVDALNSNKYTNLVVDISYEESLSDSGKLTYINFPVDQGIVGYRVCFVNPEIKEHLKQITTLDDVRKYTIGQGVGWADTAILRHNGFKVVEISSYPNIFKMVIAGRIDLFCRGINELMTEYTTYKDIGNLDYDESFALVYLLPRFLYFNKNNLLAKRRIEEGLNLAYQDGSLKRLWLRYHESSIIFSALRQRKVFYLENPLIKKLPLDFKHKNIDLLRYK